MELKDFTVSSVSTSTKQAGISRLDRMRAFWKASENQKLVRVGNLLAIKANENQTLAQVIAAKGNITFSGDRIKVQGQFLPLVPGFSLSLANVENGWGCPACRSAHGSGVGPSREVDAKRLAANQFYYRPSTKDLITISTTCYDLYVVKVLGDVTKHIVAVDALTAPATASAKAK